MSHENTGDKWIINTQSNWVNKGKNHKPTSLEEHAA